ncbi:MAG TPA: lysoplasmalogenase [Chryseosolibacter sp.]|nr:lysoplasmalogenase [Chryseosolibacter sp.]
MKKLFLILFFLASVANLVSTFAEVPMLGFVSKPLIMLSLGAYYLTSVSERFLTVILAVACSLAGDVFLMDASYFIAGLVSFLIAHIFYIFAYRQHRSDDFSENSLQGIHKIRLAFPIILAGTGLVVILFPVLGDLKIPVIVYAAVITLMVLTALYRYGKTNDRSYWFVFSGAALFFVSDSIIALNKFLFGIQYAHFWIMLTYCAAQYLIIEGLINHHKPAVRPVSSFG